MSVDKSNRDGPPLRKGDVGAAAVEQLLAEIYAATNNGSSDEINKELAAGRRTRTMRMLGYVSAGTALLGLFVFAGMQNRENERVVNLWELSASDQAVARAEALKDASVLKFLDLCGPEIDAMRAEVVAQRALGAPVTDQPPAGAFSAAVNMANAENIACTGFAEDTRITRQMKIGGATVTVVITDASLIDPSLNLPGACTTLSGLQARAASAPVGSDEQQAFGYLADLADRFCNPPTPPVS